MQSDGCSGFWWAESVWPIRECCVAHDGGASDGWLFDCLANAGVPLWAVAAAILLMVLFRPLWRLWRQVSGR